MDFSVYSFGYGKGHDEAFLSSISDNANGDFYYIKDEEFVSQYFLQVLDELMSVLGKEAEINL